MQNSAHEVVAAVDELGRTGHDHVGFWGISRAGWICPLAIGERPDVAFWISVSGPDGEDNFRYLLETNLRIEGRSEVETCRLVAEFQNGSDSCRKGRPYAEYLSATAGLNRDPFFLEVLGGPWTEEMYRHEQAKYIAGQYQVNEESGLVIFVPAFRETLMKVQCPVLAIFGEKDTNVDWRKTVRLYRETIGSRPHADLTIRTFPEGNHGIMPCEDGGVRELTRLWPMQQYCDGYHRVMSEWVKVRLADEAVNP